MTNREIKFRAWGNTSKSMMAWDDIRPNLSLAFEQAKRDAIILMQFTGLKDRSGKEIYEGDIIQTHPDVHLGEGYKAQIIWRECGFWMDGKSEGMCTLGLGYPKGIAKRIAVIGNVWESPELLK